MKKTVYAMYKDETYVVVDELEGADVGAIYLKIKQNQNRYREAASEEKKERFRLRKQEHAGEVKALMNKGDRVGAETLELRAECYAFAGFNLTGTPIVDAKIQKLR